MNTQEIRDINTKIEELKKTIAELEAKVNEPEQLPWGPHGGWHITAIMTTACNEFNKGGNNSFVSKQAAYYAADKLKPIYKLLSYITEFDKDEYGIKDSYIFKSQSSGVWYWAESVNNTVWFVDSILMSKQCAEELVDKLNKGLVKLD